MMRTLGLVATGLATLGLVACELPWARTGKDGAAVPPPPWLAALREPPPPAPAISPDAAAIVRQNVQTRGVPDESGAPYRVGPCTVSLRSGNVACDFGVVTYDSAREPALAGARPASLKLGNGHAVVGNDFGPEQLFLVDGKALLAVQPALGLRAIEPAQGGGHTAWLEGESEDVSWSFDDKGRLVRTIAPATRVASEYAYDAAGRWVSLTSPTQRLRIDYDQSGLPAAVSSSAGNFALTPSPDALVVTRDGAPYLKLARATEGPGWLVKTIELAGKTYELSYEGSRLKSFRGDGIDVVLEWTGDAARTATVRSASGQTLQVATFDGPWCVETIATEGVQRLKRDALGRIVSREDATGRRESYALDAHGRVVAVSAVSASGGAQVVRRAKYDGFGHATEIVTPASRLSLSFDTRGRLEEEREESVGATRVRRVLAYDAQGRVLRQKETLTRSEESVVTLAYDAQGTVVAKTEENAAARTVSTLDAAAGTKTVETTWAYGDVSAQKTTVNALDGSTTESQRTTDLAGRMRQVVVVKSDKGQRQVETNELGLVEERVVDSQGTLTQYASAVTSLPAMKWIQDAVVAQARRAAEAKSAPASPPLTEAH